MKWSHVVPFATLSVAFVVPNEQILADLKVEEHSQSWVDAAANITTDTASRIYEWGQSTVSSASHAFDDAIERGEQVSDGLHDAAARAQTWLEASLDDLDIFDEDEPPHHPPPPHHGPPPPHHGPPPPHHGPPPHHAPDHGRPHHPPHHDAPNKTVWELISESKYSTKLAKLISKYDDLVETLNSTKGNVTVFAPIDSAFDKIPEHHPEPSKEELKALLSYHVVPELYPAKRVLQSYTAPTLLKGKHLSSHSEPQRIAFKLGLRGLTVNFYSRVVAVNIFATNGVIHGVSSILVPPPNAITLIDLLPSEFSTLELALGKTGLLDTLNTTDHAGGTLFAPSNFAFTKLGPKVNAFLFSKYGVKYLKALLEYHVVPDVTLYSDAYYKAGDEKKDGLQARAPLPGGKLHVELPTLLKDHSLTVDIARFAGITSIHINGFSRVTVSDGIAEDGVIHVISDVLIPPKRLAAVGEEWNGEELTVEDLVERLEPFVNKSDL